MWRRPRKPHRKPNPSAVEVSGVHGAGDRGYELGIGLV
jgi:hypothetical protein